MLAFTSAYSQFLTIFPSKHVLLCAICAFELGSLICGVAPNMLALIFGRAISGFGGTGIFASSIIILSEMTTLKERPMYIGFMGISFTIASVLGPLVGGVLSDHISWRWCFYINLPIGGIAFALLSVLVKTQHPYGRAQTYGGYGLHMLRQLAQCDLIGVVVALCWGGVSILGLEWGGVTRSWDDGSVIACLVMSVVLAVLFLSWEAFMGENAMLPLNLFKSKTLRGAAIVSVFGWASFIISVYYLSVGLQAVYKCVFCLQVKIRPEFRFLRMSATAAGIHLLPLIIVEMVAIVLAGRLVFHINAYFVILLGPAFMVVGCGLLYSITSDHPIARLMGGEIFIGLGMGMFLQNVIVVTQYEFRDQPHLMTAATGSITLMGYMGRLIGISTAGSVFENMLQVNIHKYAPDVPQSLIIVVMKAADALWKIVPRSDRSVVLHAYIKTLKTVFLVGVSTGGLAFVAALFMPKSRMDLSHDEEPEIQDVERRAGTHVMADSSEVVIQAPKVETQKVPSPLGDGLGLKDDGSAHHETSIVTFPASSAVRS